MDIVFALVGLAMLLVAGDLLVRGAIALSTKLGIPPLIVGLTIVAFGTSAPELLVSVQAVLEGAPGIAVGNVVGSNIANVLLVLGIPALVATVEAGEGVRRSYFMMLGASALLVLLCFSAPLGRWQAAVLLVLFAAMLADMVRQGRAGSEEIDPDLATTRGYKVALLLGIGLAGLPLGAHLLIEGAVGISRALGISEEAIGLTMVAIGTSLPELATTYAAAMRRETGVAMGNVIGSNIFNILGILGIASLFGPIPISAAFLQRDLWVMLGCALLLAPVVLYGWRITRFWGIVLIALYAGYTATLF